MENMLPFNNHQTQDQFFNYKHYFSIIVLAMVDANYKFIDVDVGAAGRAGDAGVFADSALKKALATNGLDLPEAVELRRDINKNIISCCGR